MEIQKKYIGTMQWSSILSKWIAIERGKEEFYANIGLLFIFEKRKPKLIKENAKNTEELFKQSDSDSDRTDNSESSVLPI